MTKEKTVKIEIDAEVYADLEKDAKKRGLTVSKYAELLCRKHMVRLELIDAEKEEEQ
jgi:hypothetical protein